MKILVIGSKGFIGEHCVKYFSASGYSVKGCDIMESNEPDYFPLKSTANDFNRLFAEHQFDYCINAAGSAHVNYSFEYPEKDFELNVSLVINLLGAIKNNSLKCKFINFSSAAVYGNPGSLPTSEKAETKPLSPYGYHKLLSEKLLYEYYKFFNLNTCSLRIFSAYGEGLKKQLFWDLYNKAMQSDSVTLFGTGMESRDFIYIKDLITIIDLVIKKGEFNGEVYNVANGDEILIKDAVNLFFKELGWKRKIIFSGKEKTGDPINWRADMTKIQALGYVKNYDLQKGISNYCKWLKELK